MREIEKYLALEIIGNMEEIVEKAGVDSSVAFQVKCSIVSSFTKAYVETEDDS